MTSVDTGAMTGSVRFLGDRRAYWRLLVRGAVLLMVTLGIYRFWLTTDVRSFLWSNTEIAGETLDYSGTPLELLLGFLFAVGFMIPVYGAFFLAALDLGTLGQMSGVLGFVALAVLGQYAIYRARRYRLTRTIYRGLRFQQAGSAWRYALRAIAWWGVTALTLGLAYPWQRAALERYKMRNTSYGNLPGRFEAKSGALFLHGLPMWLLAVGPLVVALAVLVSVTDLTTVPDILAQGGDDMLDRADKASPGFVSGLLVAMALAGGSVPMAALLFPAFQAVQMRWWLSGLRFGSIAVISTLRMRHVYGAYLRFLLIAAAFSIALSIGALPALFIAGYLTGGEDISLTKEFLASGVLLAGYVIAALGFSTIYRATVKYSLWQRGAESLQLSGIEALDRVVAAGEPSSPFGEGLADALNIGGY